MPTAYTPRIPEKALSPDFWTYQDAVEWVLDFYGRNLSSKRDLRLAKRAVHNAYNALTEAHAWRYYRARYSFQTDTDYDTGTIAYDHTGGTYERQVTLTGGTWPANATYGEIKFDGFGPYQVADRKSSTVLTLLQDQNPGADIAAGGTFHWWRASYPMPLDFLKLAAPLDETDGWGIPGLRYVEPEAMFSAGRWWGASTVTQSGAYTIVVDRRSNQHVIVLGEPPADVRSYGFEYIRAARPLKTTEYAEGLVTVENASTVLEGTRTVWTADHIGCVLRVSANALTKPTSVYGSVDGDDNPPALTRIIASRTDADTMALDVASTVTLSGVRYTLSDPLDIDWRICRVYFQRLAEYHFAILAKDVQERSNKERLAELEYHRAAGADQRRLNLDSGSRAYSYVSGTVVTDMDSL